MTTLNAKANNAYHELITEYERENPDCIWAGFDHQRDAYETGWEAGYEAARTEVTVQALEDAADAIIVPGASSKAADWLRERARLLALKAEQP